MIITTPTFCRINIKIILLYYKTINTLTFYVGSSDNRHIKYSHIYSTTVTSHIMTSELELT